MIVDKVPVFVPIGSMYGIFTYMWVIYGVNVGKYSIHGSCGVGQIPKIVGELLVFVGRIPKFVGFWV